jgi:hypothetical protein
MHVRSRPSRRVIAGMRFAAMPVMRGSTILTATVASLALAGCVASSGDSSLTVANDSDFVLTEVHLAATDSPSWGPNMLPGVLFPGEELIITGIECDTYDVLVIDENGIDCELTGIDLCFDDDVWVIDNVDLAVCAFTPARAP